MEQLQIMELKCSKVKKKKKNDNTALQDKMTDL